MNLFCTKYKCRLNYNSKTSKVAEIDVEITAKLSETEEYGAKGDVDNSMRAMEEVEELRKKKQELEVYYSMDCHI